MTISCTLGLAACLTFGGVAFPAEDAFDILDSCTLLVDLPDASFVQHPPASAGAGDMRRALAQSWGAATGEQIERKGLKLAWPASGAARKHQWLGACHRFEAAFYDRSRGWSHLEKWPE